jgi:hypothetical protein
MKRLLCVLILLTIISLPVLAGNVTGIVTDGATNAPIAGARVVYFDCDSVIAVGITDTIGVYVIQNLPEDPIWAVIHCWKEGYDITFVYNIHIPISGLQLNITLNSVGGTTPPPPTPPDNPPTDSLTVIGKIQNQNFTPIPNAQILWKMTSTSTEYTTSTDANGLYELTGMKSGEYQVHVNSSGYQSLTFNTNLSTAKSEHNIFLSNATVVEEPKAGNVPKVLKLYEAYPLPFNPATIIRFALPERGRAMLRVYDNLGREVAVLANGEFEGGVEYQFTFNASNLTSGVYFSRLEFKNHCVVKKLMLVK